MSFTNSVFMELQFKIGNIWITRHPIQVSYPMLNDYKLSDIPKHRPLYNSLMEQIQPWFGYSYLPQDQQIHSRYFVIDKPKSTFRLYRYKVVAMLTLYFMYDILQLPKHHNNEFDCCGILCHFYRPGGSSIVFGNYIRQYSDDQSVFLFEVHLPYTSNTVMYWMVDQHISFKNLEDIFNGLDNLSPMYIRQEEIEQGMKNLEIVYTEMYTRYINSEDIHLHNIFKAAKLSFTR